MDKSPDAFRTISEVAEALETPAHVLRFWESRFPQIRPVKRAGGRRYYRPSDVALLTGIKRLLHEEGLTIRGVQKILREQGVRHVSGLSEEPSAEEIALEAAMAVEVEDGEEILPEPSAEEAAEATASALEAALAQTAPPDMEEADTLPEIRAIEAMEAPDGFADLAPEETAVEDHGAAEMAPAVAEEPPASDPPASDPPASEPPSGADPRQPELFAAAVAESPRSEGTGPTFAARLRALPRGGLATRREEVAALAARLADLRARMGAQSPAGHAPSAGAPPDAAPPAP